MYQILVPIKPVDLLYYPLYLIINLLRLLGTDFYKNTSLLLVEFEHVHKNIHRKLRTCIEFPYTENLYISNFHSSQWFLQNSTMTAYRNFLYIFSFYLFIYCISKHNQGVWPQRGFFLCMKKREERNMRVMLLVT